MTAAEPPEETDSPTTPYSPWRRPLPRWTLFDSLWSAERRDEPDRAPAGNGHGGSGHGGNGHGGNGHGGNGHAGDGHGTEGSDAVPSTTEGTRDPDPSASPTDGADPSAGAMTSAEAVSPPPPDDAKVNAQAIAIAIAAIAAVMAEEASPAIAPVTPPDATPPEVPGDAGTSVVASPDARALPMVVAPSDAGLKVAAVEAPTTFEPHRRARHAKRATRGARVWQAVGLLVLAGVLVCVGIGVVALVQGTWSINPVLSGSMRPGFAVGGVVISERVPVDQLALRDVIVFQDPLAPSQQIVHRIVGIVVARDGVRTFFTQGDANATRDPWQLRIPGGTAYRVRWSVPLVGYVAIAYENHRGIALIVAGVLLLLVAIPTITRARRRRPASSTTAT